MYQRRHYTTLLPLTPGDREQAAELISFVWMDMLHDLAKESDLVAKFLLNGFPGIKDREPLDLIGMLGRESALYSLDAIGSWFLTYEETYGLSQSFVTNETIANEIGDLLIWIIRCRAFVLFLQEREKLPPHYGYLYINEAEHQDGYDYWFNFNTLDELEEDYKLFTQAQKEYEANNPR